MAAPNPSIKNVADIKFRLLRPALTSHYECYFVIPEKVGNFMGKVVPANTNTTELLTLSCSEASLPGSSLATHELNNDFTGVTQRHAYRRLYDDRADFTFYVGRGYEQIRVFERWIQFISGEQQTGSENLNSFYRVKYPKDYKTTIYITKFERDINQRSKDPKKPNNLVYSFYNAFPVSINSMPVSYDSSQLLKCTVSFSYDRYMAENKAGVSSSGTNPEDQSLFNNGSLLGYESALGLDLGVQPVDYFNNTSPNQFNISAGTFTVGSGTQ